MAIDGACRRNGQPDCVSAGAVFVMNIVDDEVRSTFALSDHENKSTNQRGELLALKVALHYLTLADEPAQIITDSEYLFNAMTNGWAKRWSTNGWQTAAGEAVKNKDLWMQIQNYSDALHSEVNYYHIKGHVIPFGKVTAMSLLAQDTSCRKLMDAVCLKYDMVAPQEKTIESIKHAQDLSQKNNDFGLPPYLLKRFVVANVVVDEIATRIVDSVDALS